RRGSQPPAALGRRLPGRRGPRRDRGHGEPPPGPLPGGRFGGRRAPRRDRLGSRDARASPGRGDARARDGRARGSALGRRPPGRRPGRALGLPPAAADRAPRRPRHRARRRAAHPRLRPPMRRVLAGLLVLLAAAARAADEATIALNFQDVELPVLAKFVSEVTGRNFIIDDRVRGKVTILSPTRITADEAYVVFQSVL